MNEGIKRLIVLALDRAQQLGQEAMTAHIEMVRWRDPKLESNEAAELGLRFNSALNDQFSWIKAISETVDAIEDV